MADPLEPSVTRYIDVPGEQVWRAWIEWLTDWWTPKPWRTEIVEHDMRTVAQCDWVIDVGPGAGDRGGTIVAAGRSSEIAARKESRTAYFLAKALG